MFRVKNPLGKNSEIETGSAFQAALEGIRQMVGSKGQSLTADLTFSSTPGEVRMTIPESTILEVLSNPMLSAIQQLGPELLGMRDPERPVILASQAPFDFLRVGFVGRELRDQSLITGVLGWLQALFEVSQLQGYMEVLCVLMAEPRERSCHVGFCLRPSTVLSVAMSLQSCLWGSEASFFNFLTYVPHYREAHIGVTTLVSDVSMFLAFLCVFLGWPF